MSKDFKVGDKVIIPKMKECGFFTKKFVKNCKFPINDPITISSFFESSDGRPSIFIKESAGGIPLSLVERYIEPKFNVGYKFIHPKSNRAVQVVSVKFNLKLKQYCYLVYQLLDGYHGSLVESDIPVKVPVQPYVMLSKEEATKRLSKALGKKVIISNEPDF